jgi:hypothetical protein
METIKQLKQRYGFILLMLLIYVLSYGLHFNGYQHDMPTMLDKYYSLTKSIVEDSTLDLNKAWEACEKNVSSLECMDATFVTGSGGNKYSKFSPGLSFAGVPFYFAAYKLGFGRTGKLASLVFLNTLLSLLIIYIIYRISLLTGNSERDSKCISLIFGLATILYTYSQTFACDVLGALLAISSFYYFLIYSEKNKTAYLIPIGLFTGYLYAVKPVMLIVPVALFPFVLFQMPRQRSALLKSLTVLAVSFAVTLSMGAAYYQAVFSSPFNTGYTAAFQDTEDGPVVTEDFVTQKFSTNPLLGAPIIIISILACSPFLAFSLFYLFKEMNPPKYFILLLLLISLMVFGSWFSPLGAWAFGPRLELYLIILLSFPLSVHFRQIKNRRLFHALLIISLLAIFSSQNFATWSLWKWLEHFATGT